MNVYTVSHAVSTDIDMWSAGTCKDESPYSGD